MIKDVSARLPGKKIITSSAFNSLSAMQEDRVYFVKENGIFKTFSHELITEVDTCLFPEYAIGHQYIPTVITKDNFASSVQSSVPTGGVQFPYRLKIPHTGLPADYDISFLFPMRAGSGGNTLKDDNGITLYFDENGNYAVGPSTGNYAAIFSALKGAFNLTGIIKSQHFYQKHYVPSDRLEDHLASDGWYTCGTSEILTSFVVGSESVTGILFKREYRNWQYAHLPAGFYVPPQTYPGLIFTAGGYTYIIQPDSWDITTSFGYKTIKKTVGEKTITLTVSDNTAYGGTITYYVMCN